MWYLLQTITFCYVVYVYMAEIETHQPVGYVFLIAAVAAFLVTKIISITLDGVMRLTSLTAQTLVNPGSLILAGQKLRLRWRAKQSDKRSPVHRR